MPFKERRLARLHFIWYGMKRRCYDSRYGSYRHYGARGIGICPEWKDDFAAFYSWALSHGYADNLTIDRKENDGNYEPSNCRWATRTEQARNRRNNRNLTLDGITLPLHAWAAKLGISTSTLWNRHVNLGKSDEEVLTPEWLQPPKLAPEQYAEIRRKREIGESLKSIARDFGCSAQTVMRLMRKVG